LKALCQGTTSVVPLSRLFLSFPAGFRDCVATANPNLRWDKTLEDQSPQPRSGDICVSPGRKPGVKWEIRLSRGAAALAATQSLQPAGNLLSDFSAPSLAPDGNRILSASSFMRQLLVTCAAKMGPQRSGIEQEFAAWEQARRNYLAAGAGLAASSLSLTGAERWSLLISLAPFPGSSGVTAIPVAKAPEVHLK
jgi:hypothetical protein